MPVQTLILLSSIVIHLEEQIMHTLHRFFDGSNLYHNNIKLKFGYYIRSIAMEHILTPTIGEILKEEFMKPFCLSADDVAKGTKVPMSTLKEVLHEQRSITVETSTQLGRFFGVSDHYLLNMQNDINARHLEK